MVIVRGERADGHRALKDPQEEHALEGDRSHRGDGGEGGVADGTGDGAGDDERRPAAGRIARDAPDADERDVGRELGDQKPHARVERCRRERRTRRVRTQRRHQRRHARIEQHLREQHREDEGGRRARPGRDHSSARRGLGPP